MSCLKYVVDVLAVMFLDFRFIQYINVMKGLKPKIQQYEMWLTCEIENII